MTELSQFKLLAEYNQLMNQRQFAAAAQLSKDELEKDMGAFFHSVLGSLNHILVGDILWLKRFAEHPSCASSLSVLSMMEKPQSLDAILFRDFNQLSEQRQQMDQIIVDWIRDLSDSDLDDCIYYTSMAGKTFNKPFSSLITNLFMHQVHHRGQVTTLLSQCGVDFGDTDLIEIIPQCSS